MRMPYNPSSDFVGLWHTVTGGVEKAQMPGLDFVIQALGRAGIMRVVTSATAPIVNQSTTAWFRPNSPSFAGEGLLFLWDTALDMYVPATPELFHKMVSGGDTPLGDTVPEAPNDGKQYGRQNLQWTEVIHTGDGGNGGTGGGVSEMAFVGNAAPSSPAAGQMWWDDDDNILKVYDGESWNTVGPQTGPSGQLLTTSTLVFAMTIATTVTVGVGTWTIVPYTATPQIDLTGTPSGWDPVTKKLTPKKPGYYIFNARGYPSTSGGIAILKNDDGTFNSTASDIVIGLQTSTTAGWLSTNAITQMNGTTDYVRVFAYAGAGGTLTGSGGNPIWSALVLA
jgi:hypothetical protein